jgi:hypothetical protein
MLKPGAVDVGIQQLFISRGGAAAHVLDDTTFYGWSFSGICRRMMRYVP